MQVYLYLDKNKAKMDFKNLIFHQTKKIPPKNKETHQFEKMYLGKVTYVLIRNNLYFEYLFINVRQGNN